MLDKCSFGKFRQATGSNLRKRNLSALMFAGALVALLSTSPAYAYLDPGAGSIILQSVLAAIAIAAASIGVMWQRIKLFFSSLFGSRKTTIESETEVGE